MVPSLPVRLYAGSTQSVTALCRSTGNFTAGCKPRRSYWGTSGVSAASGTAATTPTGALSERRTSFPLCREIAIADEPDPVYGDLAPDHGTEQRRELFDMAVAGHRGDERGAALYRRMEIDFADPLRQMCDQRKDPLLHHAAAPGEAEDVVVGAQTSSPQAAPQ